jgi:hypothetical protein
VIGWIPGICYTGNTWSWSSIYVFSVLRALRKITSIFSSHALSVMLVGPS